MTVPEFSRPFDMRQADGRSVRLEAGETERRALARRFGLVRIERMEAEIAIDAEGPGASGTGRLSADIVQSCAASAEDLPVSIDEPLSFRFVPANADHRPDEEIELNAADLDEIEFTGTSFDLGEAVAQSLGLAIDPFATGPGADAARQRAGIGNPQPSGPFAGLATWKKDPE